MKIEKPEEETLYCGICPKCDTKLSDVRVGDFFTNIHRQTYVKCPTCECALGWAVFKKQRRNEEDEECKENKNGFFEKVMSILS